ncbi:MAG TPA: YCF48-related protein [Agriterribacter sp.]|nr:YCF48-related protein [Agriterribacter sp.]
MRKIIVLFPILFCLAIVSCRKGNTADSVNQTDSLGSGWSKVDIGEGNFFIDVFFFGSMGFGTGEKSIFISRNEGTTWAIAYQAELEITNIAMGSKNNAVFVSGSGGKIYFTSNGGDSFDSTTVADSGIYDAFFVSENMAYALGDNLWKTTDGGNSWELLHAFTPPSRFYKTLFFSDEMNGWVSVPTGLFKTTDGGVNWVKIDSDLFSWTIGGIFFHDANSGYISNRNNILKTEDGGASWNIVYTDPQGVAIDIHFVTRNLGYFNTQKSIYKTTDGGLSWSKEVRLRQDGGNSGAVELHFTDANHGWVSGSLGSILKYVR